ncbi:Trehalose-6-P synthase/phosphatase complex subunit [Didymella glomerata]|uniref:Trehalose-6-P synthase/phosphatase complex subunit n=1 Tax=Didymella glomerata TaxID=749621 RepID=A0A9W9BVM7_9PLEO|nr:Trehalose-6-P synthase/phosphatase complex subunit [Didymella glomerata]
MPRVKAVPIANSVIIEPIDIDKLTAIRYIWSNYLENARPDFLLVAGNDRSDENVFSWAKELKEDRRVRYIQTVNIGRRNSMATATLTNGATSKSQAHFSRSEDFLTTRIGLINILNKLAKIRTV